MPLPINETWVLDMEYISTPGNLPTPICLVAREIDSGKTLRVWLEGDNLKSPPLKVDDSALFVAYFGSSAEWLCFYALGWQLPEKIIDLYVEFRVETNGLPVVNNSLLGACSHHNIATISDAKKDSMRERILRGAPFTDQEKQEILDYCGSDVDATCRLYQAMKSGIDFDRALFRGQYMKSVAFMEYNGIPIDTETLSSLNSHWEEIKLRLIRELDRDFGFYEGTTFKIKAFSEYLDKHGIMWEKTPTGQPKLDDDTFKSMVLRYPDLQPIRDLRDILSKLKLNELAVGKDGRNRAILSPFRTKTGRNAPSNSRFVFGLAKWLRSLIKPEKGRVLAYIDYSQQEFYIAAILSGDLAMQQAYESGDPYIGFAKRAGAVPADATKKSHGAVRELYKTCVLGLQYGMGSESLAYNIGKPEVYARELIHHHKRVFQNFWAWQNRVSVQARFSGRLHTCYGWQYYTVQGSAKEDRTVRNFLVQATGAEILRVASYLLQEANVKILAPVHDAILIECDEENAEATIKRAQEIMEQASKYVLGKPVRTEAMVIRYPHRYVDPHGGETWDKLMKILDELGGSP